jgi:hypothetical protein
VGVKRQENPTTSRRSDGGHKEYKLQVNRKWELRDRRILKHQEDFRDNWKQ